MFLCDFHMHSKNSDGKLSIAQLVDMYGQRGFGAIAITDHLCEVRTLLGQSAKYLQKTLLEKEFQRYLGEIEVEAKRAMIKYNMLVLPGVEFTKNSFSHKDSAHIVAIGINDFIDPDLDVETIIDQVHFQGAIAIAAHPVPTRKMEPQTYHLWHNRDRLSKKIDAWEVASGGHLFQEVFESGLPMLANSDLHYPKQMSSWKTVMEGKKTRASVLRGIKEQNLNFTYYDNPCPWALSESRVGEKSPFYSANLNLITI